MFHFSHWQHFMQIKIKKYYSSKEDFHRFYLILKHLQCPHCKTIGFLILHGYLKGLDYKNYGKEIERGHRIFCSNRGHSNGCGRTFSILVSNILKKLSIRAEHLWRFLKNTVKGLNIRKAFKPLSPYFAYSSAYRLWKKFCNCQSRIRTYLSRLCQPPNVSRSHHPTIETILHLKSVFKSHPCPITAFQENFQVSFL